MAYLIGDRNPSRGDRRRTLQSVSPFSLLSDFGTFPPLTASADFSMSFRTGFAEAQSADEVRFGPSDATQFSQGAALNPLIISNVRRQVASGPSIN